MGKWLAAAGLALIALLVLLWYQIQSPSAAPTPVAHPVAVAPAAVVPAADPKVAHDAELVAQATSDKPKKLDPQSDAFFYKFDEVVPQRLDALAAKCYTGGLNRVHRNSKLSLLFKTKIVNGEFSVYDVKIKESTLNNPAMEACMIREVTGAHWHDDELPDWTQDDSLVIRPERGMKKHTEENIKYEGSGPIGPAVMKPGQAPPPSDTATREGANE
jgi:hypothetical protein